MKVKKDKRVDVCPAANSTGSIRGRDNTVILTAFVLMFGILPVIQTLWYVDVFILNLLHSVDLFFDLKDWKKCCKDLCFGSMYLFATRGGNTIATLLCGAGVVIAWLGSYRTDGHPCLQWIFFPCLLIWALRFFIPLWAGDAIVSIAVLKTVCVFMFGYPGKTWEDSLLVLTFLSFHFVFVQEDYNIYYLAVSYAFSVAWMFFKY